MCADFIDTNVLIYAFNRDEKGKHEKARAIVERIFSGEAHGVISNQVLAELYSVATKKMERPIKREDISTIISSIITSDNWIKIDYNAKTVLRAMEICGNGMHFWDALIVATMIENNVKKIYTENVKDFSKAGEIAAVNPFKQ